MTFVNDFVAADAKVNEALDELCEMSAAARMIGNTALADKLGRISNRIAYATADMGTAFGATVDKYIGAVDEGSTNMVRAALAAATFMQ